MRLSGAALCPFTVAAAAAQYNAGPYTQAPPPPEGYPAQQTPYKPGFEPKPGYEGKPPY